MLTACRFFSHPRASDLELRRVRRPVVLDFHRLGIAAGHTINTANQTNHERGTRTGKGQTRVRQGSRQGSGK